MPLEDMHVEIIAVENTLHATFTGDFTFDYIPEDVLSMLFPVPPDADNIGVWQDGIELPWAWSSGTYPTILPEMPTIPMIEWLGPFPIYGAVFRVDYEHDLIKRPEEFIFFYAVGTGKYFPTYEKTTTAYFDILLPPGFAVTGVWLDYTAHEYEVIDGHLYITVQSYFGPIINDLIVSLVQTPIYVATDGNDTTGDGSPENPFASIQKGINCAVDGQSVIVRPGVYTGPGNRDIDFGGRAITLRSESGPENCIIDCQGSQGNHHRGFYFHSGEDENSIVHGFTITNGYVSTKGGGIYCISSSPTINNCIITNNKVGSIWCSGSSSYGAGIYCDSNSNARIIDCTISYNRAEGDEGIEGDEIEEDGGPGGDGYGAGIYGNAIIENCIITGNTAQGGNGGSACCIHSILGECLGGRGGNGFGGGIYGNVTVRNSTISGNTSSGGDGGWGAVTWWPDPVDVQSEGGNGYGGAVYFYNNACTIENCTITDNTSSGGNGGGLPLEPVEGGNSSYGGAVYCYNNECMIENCTIVGNTVSPGHGPGYYGEAYAGVCYSIDSTTTITNSIIWDSVFHGPQIFLDSSESYSFMVISFSDVQGGNEQILPIGVCVLASHCSIAADPCFADMSNGDYHLQSEVGRWDPNINGWVMDAHTSPCIDAGPPSSDWTAELWPHGKCINMGAYGGTPQASMSLSDAGNIADLNNDGIVNFQDFTHFADGWQSLQILLSEDFDRNGMVDFNDLVDLADNWLWQ